MRITGCTLTVTDVKEAETEDGQKEYTIDFEQDVRYTAVYPASYEKTYWFYYLESLSFYDYYTGRKFNVSEMSMDVGQNSREEKTVNRISWKGKEQDIVIGSKKERAEGEVDYGEGDGFYEDTCKPVLKYTYTVTCPKDYDGLCAYVIKPEGLPADAEERNKKLSFDENGKMIEKENDDAEHYTFRDEDDLGYIPKPEDLLMIRIDDYLRSKGADQV